MENVKGLAGTKFKDEFQSMLLSLEQIGYKNYWKILNAKDYGIPQSRNRVFVVSIREDINIDYVFPTPFDTGLRLIHLLDDEVDSKYYIDEEKTKQVFANMDEKDKDNLNNLINKFETSNDFNEAAPFLTPDRIKKRQNGRRFKDLGEEAFTINTQDRHGILEIHKISDNSLQFVGGIDTTNKWIDNNKSLSRNYKEGYRVYDSNGIACTQKSNGGGLGGCTGLYKIKYKIRKLTPLESMRLMGFNDEDYNILKNNKISDSQIYKMAGNSIVVNTIEELLKPILIHEGVLKNETNLETRNQ